MADLTKLTPPDGLDDDGRQALFQHIFRRLAARRNTSELWRTAELANRAASDSQEAASGDEFMRAIMNWAQELLRDAWVACAVTGDG